MRLQLNGQVGETSVPWYLFYVSLLSVAIAPDVFSSVDFHRHFQPPIPCLSLSGGPLARHQSRVEPGRSRFHSVDSRIWWCCLLELHRNSIRITMGIVIQKCCFMSLRLAGSSYRVDKLRRRWTHKTAETSFTAQDLRSRTVVPSWTMHFLFRPSRHQDQLRLWFEH